MYEAAGGTVSGTQWCWWWPAQQPAGSLQAEGQKYKYTPGCCRCRSRKTEGRWAVASGANLSLSLVRSALLFFLYTPTLHTHTMNPLTQLCLYVSLICCLAGSCAAAYIPEEKLENLLSYAVSGNQLYINIPVQLAPWRSVDVIQYNNRLNLHWNTGAGSSFMECKDNTCKPAAVGQDLGDETDAAASYDVSPPAGVSSLKYISPQLVSSTDGDYDVSFVVVIQYDDDSRNQYAQINARFE